MLFGGQEIFRYEKSVNGSFAVDTNSVLMQIARIEGQTYVRNQTNSSAWGQWRSIAPTSAELILNCSSSIGAYIAGSSLLSLDIIYASCLDPQSDQTLIGYANDNVLYDQNFSDWYIRSLQAMSWVDAWKWASSYGGNLATVASFRENIKIQSTLASNTWLGLSWDDNREGWLWANGTALTFSNWASGEPIVSGANAAVFIDTSGFWHSTNRAVNLPSVMRSDSRWTSQCVSNAFNRMEIKLQKCPLTICRPSPTQTDQIVFFGSRLSDLNNRWWRSARCPPPATARRDGGRHCGRPGRHRRGHENGENFDARDVGCPTYCPRSATSETGPRSCQVLAKISLRSCGNTAGST